MPPLSNNQSCDGNDGDGPGARSSSGLPDECRRTLQAIQCYPQQWPPGGQGGPCKKHPLGPTSKPGMKYIQPPVPPSYKPEGRYKPSEYQMESGTIYRLSYPGVDAETMQNSKVERLRARPDNIHPSSLPLSQDTTFRLSYTGVAGERAVSCKPVIRSMLGQGPMQSITTQRHDFTPKMVGRAQPIAPGANNIHLSTAKMEDNTTMRLSYQPAVAEKVQSYKPIGVYKKPDYKLDQDTVHRLSYQPWEPMPKEEYPWRKTAEYQQPVYSMENNTIYRASYLPNEAVERPASFKPIATFKPSDLKFAQETIYRESYQDAFTAYTPVQPINRGVGNIALSTHPMSQDTTFRLSYTGVPGERAISYKPINRSMMSAGPMQSVTTQRHDFTPKPFVPTENYKPAAKLNVSDHKMEDTTTFRASYLPNEPLPRPESYKPISIYKKPAFGLESDTVNRLSYQPWTAGPKEEYPWMKKPEYQQPTHSMDGTSIYRGSYAAPGTYIPDENSPPRDEACTCKGGYNATDDL